MIIAWDEIEETVHAALSKFLTGVELEHRHPWGVDLFLDDASCPWAGRAWLEDVGWLRLWLAPRTASAADTDACRRYLAWNARLPGSVKIVLDEALKPVLQAELAVMPAFDISTALEDDCAGFRLAAGRLRGDIETAPWPDPSPREQDPPDDVMAMCQEAGWPCQRHEATAPTVTLDSADSVCRARLEAWSGDGVRFNLDLAELTTAPAMAAVCRDAASVLLLRAAAGMPMVRPVARTNGALVLGAQATLAGGVSPEGIHHALCALSLFDQHTRREVTMLTRDQDIAQAYLDMQGRNATPQP